MNHKDCRADGQSTRDASSTVKNSWSCSAILGTRGKAMQPRTFDLKMLRCQCAKHFHFCTHEHTARTHTYTHRHRQKQTQAKTEHTDTHTHTQIAKLCPFNFERTSSPLQGFTLKHLCDILKPKRLLLLWKGMLSDLGQKDMGVFDEVVEETNLLGQVPHRVLPSNR